MFLSNGLKKIGWKLAYSGLRLRHLSVRKINTNHLWPFPSREYKKLPSSFPPCLIICYNIVKSGPVFSASRPGKTKRRGFTVWSSDRPWSSGDKPGSWPDWASSLTSSRTFSTPGLFRSGSGHRAHLLLEVMQHLVYWVMQICWILYLLQRTSYLINNLIISEIWSKSTTDGIFNLNKRDSINLQNQPCKEDILIKISNMLKNSVEMKSKICTFESIPGKIGDSIQQKRKIQI